MAATVGTGATITFSTGFFAEILAINSADWSREVIETTHMGTTTARTFTPSTLYDSGTFSVELLMVPGTTPVTPMTAAAETVTVTFPDVGTATYAASGFMTEFSYSIPLGDRITATASIKFTGAITVTP